ncbi:hypothetical protein [Methylophaga sp.]|uniref:hypothetical protein n=1 Tax=Methylophaga sp. TaxID=2024840 RepID=UPI00272A0DF7|nr:hypothetical protein [Methylophaga sp.]
MRDMFRALAVVGLKGTIFINDLAHSNKFQRLDKGVDCIPATLLVLAENRAIYSGKTIALFIEQDNNRVEGKFFNYSVLRGIFVVRECDGK